MDIIQIKPYEKNAKKHPKKQVQQIAESIKNFGFNQPIVVDENNVIIIGHGRFEAAKLLGLTEVPAIKVKLTDDQAKAYRLADNKLNESDWDMDLVVEELKLISTQMIDLTGFSPDLIIETGNKEEDVPAVPIEPKAKLGDFYQLGRHFLICGDSTDEKTISKLMDGEKADMVFTDPPYNVAYEGGGSYTNHKTPKRQMILNDEMTKGEFYKFLEKIGQRIIENCTGGVYICMSSSEIDQLKHSWEAVGGHWQSFIIWVKNNFTLSRADYQNTYEPILYGWPSGVKNHHFIDRRDLANVWEDLSEVKTEFDGDSTTITFQGFKVKIKGKIEKGEVIRKKQKMDIWRFDKPVKSAEHPTMKPVSLVTEAIINSSKGGGSVLDLFGGSGSTLIAAEKTNRTCYMCELDPKYIDVIISRWEKYTGQKATKLK